MGMTNGSISELGSLPSFSNSATNEWCLASAVPATRLITPFDAVVGAAVTARDRLSKNDNCRYAAWPRKLGNSGVNSFKPTRLTTWFGFGRRERRRVGDGRFLRRGINVATPTAYRRRPRELLAKCRSTRRRMRLAGAPCAPEVAPSPKLNTAPTLAGPCALGENGRNRPTQDRVIQLDIFSTRR